MTFAAAVPGPDGQPLDQIRLAGVTATGHHGVLPHEREEGQEFRADVVLHLDTRAAASSDDLERTVSYADVAQDVHDVLAGSPADLVETVAERVAAVVLARPAVQAVDVRVHKPQAPIPVPFDDVEVVVRRDREHPPVVPAASPAEPVAEEPSAAALPAVAAAGAMIDGVPDLAPAPVPPAPVAVAPALAAEPAPEPEPAGDPLDATPAEPVEAVLALGANLGDAQVTLRQAVTDVDRLPGVQVMDVSPLARTAAVGGPEQPDFLNAVLVVRTTLSPRDLLRSTQQVEAQHGRVREERWGPRTLDVDIVQYGSLVATAPDLELPHPRAQERAFVLVPWAEVAPDAVLAGPGGGLVGQLAVTAPDRAGIRWLALDWLTGPTQSTGQIAAGAEDAVPSTPVPQSPPAGPAPAEPRSAEPYAPEPPVAGPSGAVPQAAPFSPVAPPVVEPPAAPEPHRPESHRPESHRPEPPAAPQAFAPGPFGQPEPDQPATPRPFAAVPSEPTRVAPPAEPHPPLPPVTSVPTSFAPEYTPGAYAPEPYAPAQHPAEEPAPEAYAPEQYAPEQFTPEQYAPEQFTPEPLAPGPVRHEPVPPAPDAGAPADGPALPDPFAPHPGQHPFPGGPGPQERYGEDDR